MNSVGIRPARPALFNYLSLFTSLSTLLCCALPSLLVLLGLGATVASALSFLPFLVTLSHHKKSVFALSGILIALSFAQTYCVSARIKNACPPDDPEACNTASRFSRIMLWISAVIYAMGFFAAFILGPLLAKFDQP
jgi:mercuric ion transport protein